MMPTNRINQTGTQQMMNGNTPYRSFQVITLRFVSFSLICPSHSCVFFTEIAADWECSCHFLFPIVTDVAVFWQHVDTTTVSLPHLRRKCRANDKKRQEETATNSSEFTLFPFVSFGF